MKKHTASIAIIGVLMIQLFSCQPNSYAELREALTFYVSFDNGTTADYALGDAEIYTANGSYVDGKRKLEELQVGMNNPSSFIKARTTSPTIRKTGLAPSHFG